LKVIQFTEELMTSICYLTKSSVAVLQLCYI